MGSHERYPSDRDEEDAERNNEGDQDHGLHAPGRTGGLLMNAGARGALSGYGLSLVVGADTGH